MCAEAHPGDELRLTATVTSTGPAVMSKRTALLALTAAALSVVSTAASASTREVVRYNSEAQAGTIVVKTAERKLYLVLGDGTAIRYAVAVGRPGKQWRGEGEGGGQDVQPGRAAGRGGGEGGGGGR